MKDIRLLLVGLAFGLVIGFFGGIQYQKKQAEKPQIEIRAPGFEYYTIRR